MLVDRIMEDIPSLYNDTLKAEMMFSYLFETKNEFITPENLAHFYVNELKIADSRKGLTQPLQDVNNLSGKVAEFFDDRRFLKVDMGAGSIVEAKSETCGKLPSLQKYELDASNL